VAYAHEPAAPRIARLETATGLSGILFLLGFLVQGNPPVPEEPAATVAEFLRDERSGILAGDCILAVAAVPFFWFLGVLRDYFDAADERRGARVGALGMGVGTAIVLCAAAIQAALVLNIAATPEAVVRFGFDSFNSLITIAGGLFAVGTAGFAASGAAGGRLPPWLSRAGFATAALQLITLPGLVLESGAFAAGGPVALVAFVALVAWFLALTAQLMKDASR
jgi:hypothetical protein